MKSNLRKNYLYNLAYQIFSLLAPLLTTPYVARVLKADGVGLYSYTYSIATAFVALAQLGTVIYGQREIAYHKEDRQARSEIFWNIAVLRLCTVLMSSVLYFCIFCFGKYADMFRIQMLCIIAVAFDISWFYQGIEEFGKVALRDILSKVVSITCVFLLVKTQKDVGLYSFILAAAIIGGRIVNWVSLPKYVSRVRLKTLRPLKGMHVILMLFIPQIASQLYTVIDKSMIGMMTTTTFESGYYAQADRIIKLCMAVLTSIVTVIMPRIAQAHAQSNPQEIQRYMKKTYRFIWMMGLPMMLGLICVIHHIIPWFLGEGYGQVGSLVLIFSVQILLMGLSNATGTYLVAIERQKTYAFSMAAGALFNILLNAILIPRMLATGAAIASVAAETLILGIELYAVRREFCLMDILKESVVYLPAAAGMTAVLLLIRPGFSANIPGTFALIAIGGCLYFALLLLYREPFFLENLKRVVRKRA